MILKAELLFMDQDEDDKPPGRLSNNLSQESAELPQPDTSAANRSIGPIGKRRKWRAWHEREIPVTVDGNATKAGVSIRIKSHELSTDLSIAYPNSVWEHYPKQNKVKLVDNITYIFTAHLPFLLKGNIRLNYNTAYPHVYSWANQCFTHFLPAYWYIYRGRRGSKVFPLLKTLLNSRALFSETKDIPPKFPETIDEQLILPFTFGKDSFLTYNIAKDIGLNPTLVYFNEPSEMFAREHKLKLIEQFSKEMHQKVYYLDNPLGNLREFGEGWFGWELALTSWALLSLPFAYHQKAGYIVFSNESSCNDFFYDSNNLRVIPDYEQSGQATEELSTLTQALSEGEVYTTTFLQGLDELAIIAVLKNRYPKSFKYLMSCWAETEAARYKRWCASCSKCARIYLYLVANGIDPIKEAGYKDNMFQIGYERLYNVFGQKAEGMGFDSFGLNYDQQILAFYLAYLRGNQNPLVKKFCESEAYSEVKVRFRTLLDDCYELDEENLTPPQWKTNIDRILKTSLSSAKDEILKLHAENENR
jgi:hypothetical protein